MKHVLTFLLAMVILAMGPACKKDQPNRVPSVPVDITLYLHNPNMIDLTVVGGWTTITGGSRGIIVYRSSPDEFIALDRHCPYEVDNGDRVFVDSSLINASDSLVCGSRFTLTDGSVTQGPAEFPLTRYQASYNSGSNILRITN